MKNYYDKKKYGRKSFFITFYSCNFIKTNGIPSIENELLQKHYAHKNLAPTNPKNLNKKINNAIPLNCSQTPIEQEYERFLLADLVIKLDTIQQRHLEQPQGIP